MKKLQAAIALIIALILPAGSFAENKKPPLSLKAKRALDRGVGFAQKEKWEEAIKNFQEAQKLAPREPHCLLNLALAYERKGSEAISLYWYYAYMAAAPDADNITAVEKKAEEVRLALEAKLKKCLAMSEESLRQMEEYYAKGDPEYFVLPQVSDEYNAERLKRSLESADSIRAIAYHGVAFSAAILGEYEKAYKIADLILNCKNADNFQAKWEEAYRIIAHHQVLRGDIAQALNTIGKVQDPKNKMPVYLNIAERLAGCSRFDAAKEYMQKAEDISNKTQKEEEKSSYYHSRVFIYLAMKDFENAKKSARLMQDSEWRNDDLAIIKKRENKKEEDFIDDFVSGAREAEGIDYYRDLGAYLATLKDEKPDRIIWRISQLIEEFLYNLYSLKELPCK
jgi:tetratricopeptide (TPR) repeat protein